MTISENVGQIDSVASLPKHCSISPQRRGGRGENLEKTLRLGGELTKRRWACYSLDKFEICPTPVGKREKRHPMNRTAIRHETREAGLLLHNSRRF